MRAALAAAVVLILVIPAAVARGGNYVPPPGDAKAVFVAEGLVHYRWVSPHVHELRFTRFDGRESRRIAGVVSPAFAVSPDGRRIATNIVAAASSELAIMDLEGRKLGTLSRDEIARDIDPAWSPDGSHVVFARADALFLAGTTDASLRRLADGGGHADWSPDGRAVVFDRFAGGSSEIYVVALDGSEPVGLSADEPGGARKPAWSPDGSRIAYLGPTGVTVVSPDGTARRSLGFPRATSFAWSPDGRRLAVADNMIGVVDVATGAVARVSPAGESPSWSPDGATIAFATGGECRDRTGVYLFDVATGSTRRATNDCRIFGTSGDDTISGSGLADILLGLAGHDTLTAVDGYVGDTLDGGPGNDLLRGDGAADDLLGGPGADRLQGGADRDVLDGGTGQDSIHGEGGQDTVSADDGYRDTVTCGTSRQSGTWEYDVARVDAADAVAADCEVVYRDGVRVRNAVRAALEVTVWPRGRAHPPIHRRLRCSPAGGTHPSPAAACAQLARAGDPFRPIAADAVCTQVYGGPAYAVVKGVFEERGLYATFQRRNGCEIARWDRIRYLFR